MRSTSKQIVNTIFSFLVAAQLTIAQASQGCFTSSTGLQSQGLYIYQSTGYCQKLCTGLNMPVSATTGGSDCWCGSQLPPASSKTSDSQCSKPCQGFPAQMCGGDNAWSVALTGVGGIVSSAAVETSTSTSSTNNGNVATSTAQAANTPQTTAAPVPSTTLKPTPSVVTIGNTVVVTAPGQTTTAPAPTPAKEKSKGPNTAGIAAGVVVGIAAACAIAGGFFLFLRHRRRRAVEEEYRRNASINNFTGGQKPTSAGGSISDSRLEPSVMMQRRQSDGSIADNQDYSRRILKVTNPDGT